MTIPRVSVVLPVRNAAETVATAIESIMRQSFTDWELVAVDDGSTDETPAQLTALAAKEPRVRVIRQRAAGIVSALNEGIRKARGTVIARMDADDESDPNRLARQIEFLDRHPDIGLVGALVAFGGDPVTRAGYALHVAWLNSLITHEQITLNRFVEAPFAHPSVAFRRELVDRHGGYREGAFPEDFELWLRWIEAGVRMAKVPEVLVRWNDPPGRLSRADPRYDREEFFACKAPFLARWLARNIAPDRRLFVWGAGRPTRRRAQLLGAHGIRIQGYVDIDPRKVGRTLDGCRVIPPDALPAPDAAFVLGYVGKRGAHELIRDCLIRRGYVEGRDFLMAA